MGSTMAPGTARYVVHAGTATTVTTREMRVRSEPLRTPPAEAEGSRWLTGFGVSYAFVMLVFLNSMEQDEIAHYDHWMTTGAGAWARVPLNAMRTFGITVAVLVVLFGCHSRTNPVVPAYLLGVWKTSAPQYADRSFEITPGMVILNTGDDAVAINAIVGVEQVPTRGNILYVISYEDREGQKHRFAFYYDPTPDAIRFEHQNRIDWTKEKRL
jgi:hypothetical protein